MGRGVYLSDTGGESRGFGPSDASRELVDRAGRLHGDAPARLVDRGAVVDRRSVAHGLMMGAAQVACNGGSALTREYRELTCGPAEPDAVRCNIVGDLIERVLGLLGPFDHEDECLFEGAVRLDGHPAL